MSKTGSCADGLSMSDQIRNVSDGASPCGSGAGCASRLFAGIERFGDATALVCEDGSRISYTTLIARADSAARFVGRHRRLVLTQMDNAIDPIAFYIGALRAGHVVIPVEGSKSAKIIAKPLEPNGAYVIDSGTWKFVNYNNEPISMASDLAVLLSTSGSTGSQKLVRLSHQNLWSNALAISDYLDLRPGERAITTLPAYYSYGLSILHTHLLLGHTIVLNSQSVVTPQFWDTVSKERVTSIAGVPHSYELLERVGFLDRDLPELRYLTQAGGKLSDTEVRKFAQWADRFNKRFYVMYGQTEAAPRMAYLPPADASEYPDCVGLAIPGGEFRLEPIAGVSDLPKDAGELVYKGPNVMMGYAYTQTDLALGRGPDEIHTGDIAVRNARGYYRIVGRLSRFAKLFGLRISYDAVERRLDAVGIQAAVSGDDTGLVVVTTTASSANRSSELLAEDLGIPASAIHVVEVEEIPRLSSGKTDYAKIRLMRPEPARVQSSSLSAAIARILSENDLDKRLSFSELGGDSLNYVQTVIALEEHIGYVPDNWESTPIQDLEKLANRTDHAQVSSRNPSISIQGLDIARSIAIFLALLTHSFTQVGVTFSPEVSFLPRIATPMLILLFGAMIPLLYIPRAVQSKPGDAFQTYLTKSLQCYCLYVVNVFVIWLTAPSSWLFALGSLALLGAMPYAQILIFYTIMFLLIPAFLFAVKRVNFWILFAASLAVHAAFLPLKMVPTPPSFGGQPIFQRLLDLLVGAGATPEVAGPSILHSFVLLLAGFWIGASIKRSGDRANPRLYFARQLLPLVGVFTVALLFAFSIPNYPVDWTGLTNMQLRNLNHPAYVFIFGGICIFLLSLLLLSEASVRAPPWLVAIGQRSLFGFGIGNAVIVLWPKGGLSLFPPLVNGLILLSVLMAMIYSFDYSMRRGREGRGAIRLVFEVTNWGKGATSALARRSVNLFRTND